MTIVENIYQKFQKQTQKFLYINKFFKNRPFKLLDIGAGNHSASKTKKLFPNCEYYGIDLDKNYNNNEEDFASMTTFYEMDLTKLQFDEIPDNYFDFIRMSHVIEHLVNGDKVVDLLICKMKPNGFFYIEYPGEKSKRLPSMNGTLNFYDDPTHVRLYSVAEIKNIFEEKHCKIINSGVRRNKIFLYTIPFQILTYWVRGRKLKGPIFWDLLGFAEFVLAQK